MNLATAGVPLDIATFLETDRDVVDYLNEVMATGDDDLMVAAFEHVVRSRGFVRMAEAAGLDRAALARSLMEGHGPTLATMAKVMATMGLRLKVEIIAGD